MIEHRCSIGERGGFFERLRMGTYLAHILEHVTLGTAVAGGRRGRLWPGPRNLRRRRLQGGLQVQRRESGPGLHHHGPRVGPGGRARPTVRRAGRGQPLARDGASGTCSAPARTRSCRPRDDRGIPALSAQHATAWCSSATARSSGGSKPPRPTAAAPSPSRSRRTRN